MRKYRLYSLSIVLLLVALMIFYAGCAANNQDTQSESNQVLPTGGKLLYEDDFSNPESGWSKENTAEIQRDYRNGEYYIGLNKTNWMYWIWNRKTQVFTDFLVNIDARLVNEPYSNYYGLIFRHEDDNNFYRFVVKADGHYLIGTRLDGALTQLQSWTDTSYVKEDEEQNRLSVVCKGSQINLFINKQYLTTIKDKSFSSGHVGIIVGSPGNLSVDAAFDNIQVYSLN